MLIKYIFLWKNTQASHTLVPNIKSKRDPPLLDTMKLKRTVLVGMITLSMWKGALIEVCKGGALGRMQVLVLVEKVTVVGCVQYEMAVNTVSSV
jgi:hypothetical protein